MVYEFGLKYAKLQKSGHFGHYGTGTSTDTKWVLLGGTGTTSWFLPRNADFASFGTNSLHTTSPFHNTSKINVESNSKQFHNTLIGDLELHITKL